MKKIFLILLFLLLAINPVFANDESEIIDAANLSARSNDLDFAFLYYRSIMNDYPKSKYIPVSLFAQGEYYFLNTSYKESQTLFQSYIEKSANKEGKLFAFVYLSKIAKIQKNGAELKKLRPELLVLCRDATVSKKLAKYAYRSPLHRSHEAAYEGNEIFFTVDGKHFARISTTERVPVKMDKKNHLKVIEK